MKTLQSELWPKVSARIARKVESERFHLWFRNIELVSFSEDLVELGVPNLFIAQWMEQHFAATIAEAVRQETGTTPAIKFRVVAHLFAGMRQKQHEEIGSLAQKPKEEPWLSEIRRDFQLSNFVVGPCNEFAHAAAMKVIEAGHTLFNPLFLYGGVGLGKTHILQGIWNEIRNRKRGKKVIYVPAERFMNEYVFAFRNGQVDAFRHTYRSADILLIDDVHFLRDKMGFQEEFLHTYDALNGPDKQVVMASDAHPNMMGKIKESLLSRFVSGMIVKLEPPDCATRVKILKLKAARLKKRIGPDVLQFIAARACSNVRELEGTLTTLVAYASLNKSRITVEMAREVIGAVAERKKRSIDLDKIEKVVLARFPVTRQDLHSNRRTSTISHPRQMCMYLARKHTALSSQEIADFFRKNHTTVLSAEKGIEALAAKDPKVREMIAGIERDLGH